MNWDIWMEQEATLPYFQTLMKQLDEAYAHTTVYPKKEDLFFCFACCPYEAVKVVILGQDPYHEPNQAHGLCFSVKKGNPIPRSLSNIYKELHADLGIPIPSHGYLEEWARQGVLMMNTVMSVEKGKANSHRKLGWETFSDHVMTALNAHETPIVFILWGNAAMEKGKLITNPIHHLITSAHPSPLSASRGFFGSRPFSRCNAFLEKDGLSPIDWRISE